MCVERLLEMVSTILANTSLIDHSDNNIMTEQRTQICWSLHQSGLLVHFSNQANRCMNKHDLARACVSFLGAALI